MGAHCFEDMDDYIAAQQRTLAAIARARMYGPRGPQPVPDWRTQDLMVSPDFRRGESSEPEPEQEEFPGYACAIRSHCASSFHRGLVLLPLLRSTAAQLSASSYLPLDEVD